ncbi:DEAD/DEAH box helicase [Clavibacter michiganensis]|uniref:type I restriction endonuclease subunit R n=1 Tax=Clavibacter michiganensis TaxID=28447 RepID=UPI000CE84FD8|nr:type I restriction endonuclease subunit R [Clavibacter michiganensis]PPF54298.1 DEAD/DEAH box helicase [Clavibacter michiganensis]
MRGNSEADWEEGALDRLGADYLMWQPMRGADIAPSKDQREAWAELLIRPRLVTALRKLNPSIPSTYLSQAAVEIATPSSQDAITENQRIHRFFVDGYPLSYLEADGTERNVTVRLLSNEAHENDWLAVNQVTIQQGDFKRRFDLVLYLNGMPVSIIELKKAGSDATKMTAAHAQLQTYLREFPMAFRFCVFTLISDGLDAQYGTPFTPLHHFAPWNVDEEGKPVDANLREDGQVVTPLDHALDGLYNQVRFLQILRNYTAFDEGADGLEKRIAKPHQYFAVSKAVGKTITALDRDGKAGVVWHTQGSGKSMEMELYTNLVSRHPRLKNPTVVVITDRTELDGQLYSSFTSSLLLPEKPVQLTSRAELRDQIGNRRSGGIYFTTLQKFGLSKEERDAKLPHPLLSDRRNVIVIVDEAHRSHYDDLDGYSWHLRNALPNATLIAFTGTPVSFDDRDTREVFGEYIDIYDLSRAVDDGATVPVSFEPRLIKVELAPDLSLEELDEEASKATLGLDETERKRIEQSVAVINALYGAPERIDALAADIVTHWSERSKRMEAKIEAPGKAMIVGATREICARLYAAIVELRPEWHSDDLAKGGIKVVYSGTPSDVSPVVEHVRRDSQNKVIKQRMKDVDDELQIVIVKDMMLTGFDAPPLHTLYLDRPLKGALLMQTLARVNRTFRGKEDGLLVAYAPLVDNLKAALAEYTSSDQSKKPVGRPTAEAEAVVREMVAELQVLLAGYDWRADLATGHKKAYLTAASGAVEHLRSRSKLAKSGEEDPAARFRSLANQLSRAWALASGAQTLADLRPEISFYEDVRIWMAKFDAEERKANGEPIPAEVERLLRQLVAKATATGEVLDIYEAAGMPKPSLDQLTPEFVEKTQQARNPHLAIEALRKLLVDESTAATENNVVRTRAFSERIADLMKKYTNQQLTSAEVIAELVKLAKEIAAEADRGAAFTPPLSHDEIAFYDAVAQNESAVTAQGEDTLAQIARELVQTMRRDVRTDWTVRDDVRAKLRSSIKRLLVRYRYPPDQQPAAIKLVMEQMEAMAARFAMEREGAAT